MKVPEIPSKLTTEDFDEMSWHDNYIHGIYFNYKLLNPHRWISDLILDIDYIVKWVSIFNPDLLKPPVKEFHFWIAPSTLTFHDVNKLKMDVQWNESALEIAIYDIDRKPIKQEGFPRQYSNGTIELDWPLPGGKILFESSGFTQVAWQQPVLFEGQKLPFEKRVKLFQSV